jgi:hypothetical protein
MLFKPGDIIESPYGACGKVIHTSRNSVFVAFPREDKEDCIGVFSEHQLKKIDSPTSLAEQQMPVELSFCYTAGANLPRCGEVRRGKSN